jgi:hypothetical protein
VQLIPLHGNIWAKRYTLATTQIILLFNITFSWMWCFLLLVFMCWHFGATCCLQIIGTYVPKYLTSHQMTIIFFTISTSNLGLLLRDLRFSKWCCQRPSSAGKLKKISKDLIHGSIKKTSPGWLTKGPTTSCVLSDPLSLPQCPLFHNNYIPDHTQVPQWRPNSATYLLLLQLFLFQFCPYHPGQYL